MFVATTAETMEADWFADALMAADAAVRKSRDDIELQPWSSAFKPGDLTAPRLIELAGVVMGAVVVLAANDYTASRGTSQSAPRDNLVLEAGIFLSRLGLPNVLLLREKGSKWPSDLLGVTAKEFTSPPAAQEGAAAIVANDIARSIRRFVEDLPRPRATSAGLALEQSRVRIMRRVQDLTKRLDSPASKSPISLLDPMSAYLDALGQVKTRFATTTYLESGFWTSKDLEVIAANRRMLKRIKDASGSARRLIILRRPIEDELSAQRRRRRLLRSGVPEEVARMNKEYRELARANSELIQEGFEVKVVHDPDETYRGIPLATFRSDTELALYDTSRVDSFSGFTSKDLSRVDVYDADMFLEFDVLQHQANTYFDALWESSEAEDFSSFGERMHAVIDEVEREIDYTPNWLALYDRTDGDDGILKQEETALVRKWLEKRHGELNGVVASHIDLGTCTGRYIKELRDCVRGDGAIVAIDVDPDCVQLVKLKQVSRELEPKADVQEGDIRRRDELPSRTFDMITCMMGTLCHLARSPNGTQGYKDEWQAGLDNLSKLLADDGDAFIGVWDAQACKRGHNVLSIYDERSKTILCRQSPSRQELQARIKQVALLVVEEDLVQGRLRVLHLRRSKG